MRRIAVAALAVSLAACAGTNPITTPSAVVGSGQALTGLPADGAVMCTDRSSVQITWLRDERVEFKNVATDCTADVWLVSFFAPNPLPNFAGQRAEDWGERYLAPGEDVVISVRLPQFTACGVRWFYQVDAVFNVTRDVALRSPHPEANLLGHVFREIQNANCVGDTPQPDPPPTSQPPPPVAPPVEPPATPPVKCELEGAWNDNVCWLVCVGGKIKVADTFCPVPLAIYSRQRDAQKATS